MDYSSTVLVGDENNERYLGKNKIFRLYLDQIKIVFFRLLDNYEKSCAFKNEYDSYFCNLQLSYLEFPSCFFKPKPAENKVNTYIEKGNIHFPLLICCITYVIVRGTAHKLQKSFSTRKRKITLNISHVNDDKKHLIRRQPGSLQSFSSYSAPFFCAIFPIVSTCHPMTLLGAKSYLGLPPPRCAHGFTRLQMSSSLTIARRVGSDTSATATRRRRQYLTG